jgi:hypothetical protein
MDDSPNLELFARLERMRLALPRPAREHRLLLTEKLSIKQRAAIRRRMPPIPSR